MLSEKFIMVLNCRTNELIICDDLKLNCKYTKIISYICVHYNNMKLSVNMSLSKSLVCCMIALFMFSGCDWVKKQLGMATSEDIAKLKIEMEQKQLREKQIRDSIEAARLDSLAQAQKEIPYARLDKQYYVIMGSFKLISNADIIKAELEKIGYSPVRIALKNGFDMVALAGFDAYSEAKKEITKIEDNDLCPYDVWIYSASQGLHK